ncbi:Rrf2 family transcriptional regulator [Sulfuricurvum sp.]|uniref:RrF2 family transcriptional regulator n=1 Tax=Sulfuricurvum sp. TaxID=2025608 RepID=UPI00199C6851|nr:Rrf2 family transcriptional regulator [Sulfuricurvum sp.]MBD3799473.1 Rrf2 family transcriptional regulator [Campylobacterota bacterium]MBD3806918.1 Rrf2 family transcriptional regulator [Sulfuricurvum sp.]
MYFSKTTEYAIRVLSYLDRYNDSTHSVNHLHQELGLPYKYLTRVVTDLVKKGLIVSMRGREGGVTLAKKAEDIRLCDILDAMGEPLEPNRCILGFEKCDAANPCALHDQWVAPKNMIETMLTETTLASLSRNKQTKL